MKREAAFACIDALDPMRSDFAALQERFGLHDLAVKDSLRPAQAPKLDVYGDQIYVVLKAARLEGDEIRYERIDAFVSRQHVITVRHGDAVACLRAGEAHRSGPRPRPDFILHAVTDSVADSYFPVVQMVQDEVLSMEEHLLDSFLDRGEITRLFRLRREAIRLQRMLARLSDVCARLTNLEVPCIGTEAKPYFRDVHDRFVRLDAMTGGLVEVIGAVFETSSLLEQQRQGLTTRRLAAWAAILGVPATIAAVYGMSSAHTAGALATYLYPAVLAAMLLICVALYVRFRRLRWL